MAGRTDGSRPIELGGRRGWAAANAIVACIAGVAIFALSAAGLVMIILAAAARAWSWATGSSVVDAPVWAWAPGGAAALGAFAIVVSFVGAFWWFWFGATAQVLAEVGARPVDRSAALPLFNVVEGLSIGIGRPMPTLHLVDDPVPNALSLRSRRRRTLVVTTGCANLPRDELEAICAHEIGHLSAGDAHWVTSGMVALARARRFGAAILGLGTAVLALVLAVANYGDVFLWSALVIALLLIVLGWIARTTLRRLERSVRNHADAIADVVAIRLARNPASLGAVCARLAANANRVVPTGWRSELMWFEAVESTAAPTGSKPELLAARMAENASCNERSHRELIDRAVHAYAEARVPLPPSVGASIAPPRPA